VKICFELAILASSRPLRAGPARRAVCLGTEFELNIVGTVKVIRKADGLQKISRNCYCGHNRRADRVATSIVLTLFWQWWQVCRWARSDCSKTAEAWNLKVKLHDKEDPLTCSLLSLGIQRHVESDQCLFHRFVRIALRAGTTLASCFGLISQRCESLPQDVILPTATFIITGAGHALLHFISGDAYIGLSMVSQ